MSKAESRRRADQAGDLWSGDKNDIKSYIRARLDKIEADNTEAAILARRVSPMDVDAINTYEGIVWLIRRLKTDILGDPVFDYGRWLQTYHTPELLDGTSHKRAKHEDN